MYILSSILKQGNSQQLAPQKWQNISYLFIIYIYYEIKNENSCGFESLFIYVRLNNCDVSYVSNSYEMPFSDMDNDFIPYTMKHLQRFFVFSYSFILGETIP